MNSNLPNEIIMLILEYLWTDTRTLVKLKEIFNLQVDTKQYFQKALEYYREESSKPYKYDEKIIEMYEKCGIDDGLKFDYLSNIKFRQIYKTVWSMSICCNKSAMFVIRQCGGSTELVLPYTNVLFKDDRNLIGIHTGSLNKFFCNTCVYSYFQDLNIKMDK